MAVQHLLDFARVDIESAANDHVFLAVHDEEIALGVHGSDIARVKPAATHRIGRGIGSLVVSFHDIVTSDQHLARLAYGHGVTVIVADHHFDAPNGSAD